MLWAEGAPGRAGGAGAPLVGLGSGGEDGRVGPGRAFPSAEELVGPHEHLGAGFGPAKPGGMMEPAVAAAQGNLEAGFARLVEFKGLHRWCGLSIRS